MSAADDDRTQANPPPPAATLGGLGGEFAITVQLTADQLAILSDIALRSSVILGQFVSPQDAAKQLLLREMRRYVK